MIRKNNLICLTLVSVFLSSCSGRIIPGQVGKSGQKVAAFSQSLKNVSAEETTSGTSSRRQSIRDPYNEDSNVTYDGHTINSVNQRNKDFEDNNSDISYSSSRRTGQYDTEVVRGVSVLSPDLKMTEGEEKTVEARVRFSGGGSTENVRWESSDHSVANISSDGKIEAVSGGSATISAYSMENFSKKDTIDVRVEADSSKSDNEMNDE